jgi:glycosyltransferase involved in cell wall biosynthesis
MVDIVSPMRVLAVMPGVGPAGGAEQSFAALAPGLIAEGLDLHLALLGAYQDLVPDLQASGVTIHDLSRHHSLISRTRAMRHLIGELRPDVVHAALWEATVPAQLASIRSGVPILVTWAVTPNTEPGLCEFSSGLWKRKAVLQIDRVLGRLCSARYHAVTAGVARSMGSELSVEQKRIHVGERGRDPHQFDPPSGELVRGEFGLPDGARLLLAVGRQDLQKGYDSLLDAYEVLAAADPSLWLIVAGRVGSATPALESRLNASAQRDRVHFIGQRGDVPELLAAADVVVCSSWREGAAGFLIEAMASGTPIVSVPLVGLEGVLEDGRNARIVDRDALARGIREVLDDGELAAELGRGGLRTFAERFTVQQATRRMLEIYSAVGR